MTLHPQDVLTFCVELAGLGAMNPNKITKNLRVGTLKKNVMEKSF
jgi:hypothetical protein